MKWTKKVIRYATKNRKSPAENRRRVGKSLSLLSVFVFAVFLVNFAVIIGTGTRFGTDLAKEAKKVHQTTRTVPAKRGTIYEMESRLLRMRHLIMSMRSLMRTISQQRVRFFM